MRNLTAKAIPDRLDFAVRWLWEPLLLIVISNAIIAALMSVLMGDTPNIWVIALFIVNIGINLLVYWVARGIGWWLRIPMLKVYYGGMLAMMAFYLLWFVVPAYTSGLYCLGDGYCFTQRPLLFHDVWPGVPWQLGSEISLLGQVFLLCVVPVSSISVLLRALFRRSGGWLAILCAVLALVAIVAGYSFADDVYSNYG